MIFVSLFREEGSKLKVFCPSEQSGTTFPLLSSVPCPNCNADIRPDCFGTAFSAFFPFFFFFFFFFFCQANSTCTWVVNNNNVRYACWCKREADYVQWLVQSLDVDIWTSVC